MTAKEKPVATAHYTADGVLYHTRSNKRRTANNRAAAMQRGAKNKPMENTQGAHCIFTVPKEEFFPYK